MNMKNLEALAQTYGDAHTKLTKVVDALQADIDQLKAKRKHHIIALATEAAKAKQALHSAVDDNQGLFEKPRSQTFSGIKFGLQKQKGSTTFADEIKTIERIRKLLPKDQAELMINVKESVHKPSVSDLTVADLKRLGITVESDSDKVMVKAVAGEVEKMINAIMDKNEIQEAA